MYNKLWLLIQCYVIHININTPDGIYLILILIAFNIAMEYEKKAYCFGQFLFDLTLFI